MSQLFFSLFLLTPEVLLVPGVVAVSVVPKLVFYLGHDDWPHPPLLGVPLEVAHPGQQLRKVCLGPVLSTILCFRKRGGILIHAW